MKGFNTNPRSVPALEIVLCPACRGLGNYSVPNKYIEGEPCKFCEGRGRLVRSTKVVYYQLDDEMTLVTDEPSVHMSDPEDKPRSKK